MSGYDIFLSSGSLLTTVNVKTVDSRQNSSLYLIGQGIPEYGTMVAQDFVWLLENFSKSTAPPHPLIGQLWHDSSVDRLKLFSNEEVWQIVGTDSTSLSTQFVMLSAATDIDFTTTGATVIFTVPDTRRYFATTLLLVPNDTPVATGSPVFNLEIIAAGDLLAATTLTIGTINQFSRVPLLQTGTVATSTNTNITLNITTAATGGALHYDAYLFGFTV